MKRTNKFDLPQPIVEAIAADPYTRGDADYSITGLLKPARIVQLEKKHANEIEEDASDRIFSLVGQAVHTILERSERTAIAEERLYCEIDGKRISGQTDRFVYEKGLLQDYKVTTVWKVMKELDVDWIAQLNCYRYLLNVNGYDCRQMQIVAILRDWSKPKARREEKYPVAQIAVLPVPVWDFDAIKKFISYRIAIHEKAKELLPECSATERWATNPVWSVTKVGGKRALKLFSNELDAMKFIDGKSGLVIEYRRGENKRCEDYCLAKYFCDQYKGLTTV